MASPRPRLRPLVAAGMAVGAALIVVVLWASSARTGNAPVATARDTTRTVRVSRRDTLGLPRTAPAVVREPARVRALVDALGVDEHPPLPCPPDYTTAELGLVLSGRDVYERRNVHIWNLLVDGGAPLVLTASTAGCRGGPPADAARLRELVLRDVSPQE